MRGQVSIEFLSLLTLMLLASALLVTELRDRTVEFDKGVPYDEAGDISRKVAYTFDHLVTDEGVERKIKFSPDLRRNYSIKVNNSEVFVDYQTGSTVFPTLYEGEAVVMSSRESYVLSYNGSDVSAK